MKKGQSHPASALSQKLLADGLLSLLEQKPFREITIKSFALIPILQDAPFTGISALWRM